MTETEYQNATNLTKVRSATSILASVRVGGPVDKDEWQKLHAILDRMDEKLTAAVRVKP